MGILLLVQVTTPREENFLNVDDLFGKKTWKQVHAAVYAKTLRKFPRAKHEDVDDAVATAMLDLVNYWVHLPSSLRGDDAGRNYNFAVQRGYWTATTWLCGRHGQRAGEESLDESDAYDPPDPRPTPCETAERADERERLRKMLAEMPERELRRWMRSYLRGETTRTTAHACGVSQNTAHLRRTAGLRRLRQRARAYGVL